MSNQNKSKLSLNIETIVSLDRVVGGAGVVRPSSFCNFTRSPAVAGEAKLGDVVRPDPLRLGSCFCPPQGGG